ncbi:40S ribosomal protein S19-1 isoform B [Glycine soja]|uniref:40S ribosomal protein S19-1 isoform B n=1 Tax=Glycine soja TaxID=3848 RepID=A0A445FBJ2_GLYSO|nr:40S ribosomal protein S19-1 isoform B [Glycine soja]
MLPTSSVPARKLGELMFYIWGSFKSENSLVYSGVWKKMELPEWTDIVKTAKFKELAPYDPDWYYIRAASMARKIYLRGGLGVGAFQRIYGGSKRNGSRPPHFCKSSGAIARHILQQLQNMSIVEIDTKGGRKITSSGRRDLDQVAGRIVVAA